MHCNYYWEEAGKLPAWRWTSKQRQPATKRYKLPAGLSRRADLVGAGYYATEHACVANANVGPRAAFLHL